MLVLMEGLKFGSKRADLLFVLQTDLAVLRFELIKSLADDVEFIDLAAH